MLSFEWDPTKAAENLKRHGVSFYEAATVFRDPLSIEVPDPDHSVHEERLLLIGASERHRLLVVSFTVRGENRIRIISARRATPRERRQYEEE
ncbi:MAG: BrnT family toxin [Gemmatimonadetes bacterium]|nr:BrnT family toxin [Gemmatimonadota bacterium]